jgi:hypothetical protein
MLWAMPSLYPAALYRVRRFAAEVRLTGTEMAALTAAAAMATVANGPENRSRMMISFRPEVCCCNANPS